MSIILFIHTILLRKYKPESIFYYPCNELTDSRELGEIIDEYYNYRKSMNVRKSIIFLDEVTFVEEWWRALKSRIDQGLFKNDVIYVSGSASIELISGKERFPGRRGCGRDYYMFPMDFSEYLRVLHKVPIVAQKFDLEKLEEIIDVNRIFEEKIFNIFQRYLVTGGFPLAIREFYENGRITSAYKTYIDWLKSTSGFMDDRVVFPLPGLRHNSTLHSTLRTCAEKFRYSIFLTVILIRLLCVLERLSLPICQLP